MEFTLPYIIIAFVLGAFLTFVFKKRGQKTENSNELSTLSAENESLKTRLAAAKDDIEAAISEKAQKEEELKAQYEVLLKEVQEQCKNLDSQLKDAWNGKIDDSIKAQLADTELLKKKLKDFEKEIDEYEIDIDSLKAKIKKKEKENETLCYELEEERRKTKEKEKIKQELKDKTEELATKTNTLKLIQALLSAKVSKEKDGQELNVEIHDLEKLMNEHLKACYSKLATHEFLSDNAQKEFPQLNNQINNLCEELKSWAIHKKKSWLYGKTTIAFIGEFSAGKTSIVNRILSQDNPNIPLLPVSCKATTAIPTYIANSYKASYRFVSPDLQIKHIPEEIFKNISKDTLDNVAGVSSLIKYFVMSYENENLKDLSILDTPGFSSNDTEDRERTTEVINECDALFWVVDVNNGTINKSSISIIKEKVGKPLYIVINKVDTKAPTEVDQVEKLIQNTFKNEGLEIKEFIRFSAKEPISNIMIPIKNIEKNKTRDTFLTRVKENIDTLEKLYIQEFNKNRKAYLSLIQKEEELKTELESTLKELKNRCEDAQSIPEWTEHLFSQDRFEMSKEQGEELYDILENILKERTHINNLFDRQKGILPKKEKIQEKVEQLKKINVENCRADFNKLHKKINQ